MVRAKKNSGPMTTDSHGNPISVADKEAAEAEAAFRAKARAMRAAKAAAEAAAAAEASAAESSAKAAGASGGAAAAVDEPDAEGSGLDETLAALRLKQAAGGRLTSKEKRKLAKAAGAAAADASTASDGLEAVTVSVRDTTEGTGDIVVDASELTVHAADRTLLEGASLQLRRGNRYALLGVNGSGKSSLVRLLAAGRIRASVLDVAAVSQELPGLDGRSAFEELVGSDKTRGALLAEEEALCRAMEAMEATDSQEEEGVEEATAAKKTRRGACAAAQPRWSAEEWGAKVARLQELGDQLAAINAHAATANARQVLAGLGFSAQMQDAPLSTLSGGWRMRAALAQALFLRPGLLLLDEPTNHLDLPAALWLAAYLTSAPMKETCVLVVSHDVGFVASVATHLLHLDHFRRALAPHRGDVWNWLAAARHRVSAQQADYAAQQAALKALKAKGMAADKAEKKLVQQDGLLLPRPREYSVELAFPSADADAALGPCLAVLDAGFRYSGGGRQLFSGLRFSLHRGTRIALVGPNGCGKSTLMQLLAGKLQPTAGEVSPDAALRVGRYDQHFDELLPLSACGASGGSKASAAAFLADTYGLEEQAARRLLGLRGLDSAAHLTPLRALSGGQKARVVFASLAAARPHVLLLDEPTNHLDLESVEALVEGINAFEGGVVLSTHDSRLVEGVRDCEVWVCGEGPTGVRVLPPGGGFAKYRQEVAEAVEAQARQAAAHAEERRAGLRARATARR